MGWRSGASCVMVMVLVVIVKCDTRVEERLKEMVEMKRAMMRAKVEVEVEEEVVEEPELILDPQEATLVKGHSKTINVSLSQTPVECVDVTLSLSDPVGVVTPWSLTLCTTTPAIVTLNTTTHGTATLTAHIDQAGNDTSGDAFCVLSVMLSRGITTTADVLGWVYTIAWDISFLPQIIHNWRRKSVIGLSFDFLTFNFLGFFSYFLFNMGMYWINPIQEQYAERNPQTILHVRLNDVIFPAYALLCTAIQISQCFIYKRAEGQRVSIPCRVITALLALVAVVGCILVPLVDDWWWLDVLYLLSYVKLAITCIKYVPQLYVNYQMRSTEGWNIYQVILDCTGGTLSLVQMFLLAANYDDWMSVLTDPAKLGLGLLSIFFNIFFFIQHFCLYRNAPSPSKDLKGVDGPLEGTEDIPELTKF